MFNFDVYCCLVFLEYDYGNVNKKTGSVLVAVIGQSVRAGNAGGVSDQFQGLCFQCGSKYSILDNLDQPEFILHLM